MHLSPNSADGGLLTCSMKLPCRRTIDDAVHCDSMQKAVNETDAPTLHRLAAYVAAEHASACARTSAQSGRTAQTAGAAEGSAAAAAATVYSDELFALNPRLPRRPPRSLPAAVLDAGGAPPQDTAHAVETLAALLTAGGQVLYS